MNLRRNITLNLIVLLALSACSPLGQTQLKVPFCPAPEKICKPGTATGKKDTSLYAEMLRTGGYFLRELNLNTRANEWQITINGDTAYLTREENGVQKLEKFRMIKPDEFELISKIESPQNTHAGNIRFTGNEVYCVAGETAGANPYRKMNIYNCKFDGNSLKLNEKLDFSNTFHSGNWESQPAFSPDGNFVFFACDNDSGFGGTDIYYSRKIKNIGGTGFNFSEPLNCGININSPCDELSPFISLDGEFLYFASEGHETFGGYDLFRSRITYNNGTPEFSEPQNLLEPINSQYNELFAESPGREDSILYFSSDRKGSFDIYVMLSQGKIDFSKYKKDIAAKHKPPKSLDLKKLETVNDKKILIDSIAIPDSSNSFLFKGNVFSAHSKLALANAEINIEWHDSLKTETSDASGAFSLKLKRGDPYEVSVHKQYFSYDKYFFDSDSVPRGGVLVHDFYLPDYATIRINFPFDNFSDPYKFTLDSNGNETNVSWQKEIDIAAQDILATIGNIDKVVLVGHTDDQGTIDYNIGLGSRRVDFVIDQLVSRGVPRSIIVSRSAGKSEPLPRKVGEDIESYRKRLRRVVLEKFYK